MSANSAAIGPLMEQLVQLVSDNENNKRQLTLLLEGLRAGVEAALAVTNKPKRKRRTKEEMTTTDGSTQVESFMRGNTRVKPYVRGPYKKSATVHASASINGRLRHLAKKDPLRVKTEEIRERLGHIAALKFLDKKMPVRRPHQKKPARKPLPRAGEQREAKREADRNRQRFNSAIMKLTNNAERLTAQSIQKDKGYVAALAWMSNGRGGDAAQAAEA